MLKRFLFILLVQFIYCQDCILEVPDDPLNKGLFKTWYVSTKEGSDTPCSQLIQQTASFVEAMIFNTLTKSFYVYNPLVLDKGTVSVLPIIPGNITKDDSISDKCELIDRLYKDFLTAFEAFAFQKELIKKYSYLIGYALPSVDMAKHYLESFKKESQC